MSQCYLSQSGQCGAVLLCAPIALAEDNAFEIFFLWNSISEFKIISIYDRILNLSEFKSNMVKDGNLTIYFGLKFPKPESGNWSIRVILHRETNQNDEIQILEEKQLFFRLSPEQERIRNFLQRSESD